MAEVIITFDREAHAYTLNGKAVPSVTQILGAAIDDGMRFVPLDVLDRARRFGQHVHDAVNLFNRGELDESDLDPAIALRLDGWKKFLHDTKAVILASELRVGSPMLGYAGTLDNIAKWGPRAAYQGRLLCDLKSGALPRSVGPQTAAYLGAYRTTTGDDSPMRRISVVLSDKGYKMHALNDPSDMAIFQSCLNIFRFNTRK